MSGIRPWAGLVLWSGPTLCQADACSDGIIGNESIASRSRSLHLPLGGMEISQIANGRLNFDFLSIEENNMKKYHLLIGPILFLLAQFILPNGSSDPATRISIVQNNASAWEIGHQIIAVAFVFLLIWLYEIYSYLSNQNPTVAYLGVLLSAFALIADYSVGVLQLLTLDLVKSNPTDLAQPILALMAQSQNLMSFAFLPTLGFLFGFGLLAFGLYRSTHQPLPPAMLGVSGLLIATGGIMQLNIVFILGAIALTVFTVLFIRVKK